MKTLEKIQKIIEAVADEDKHFATEMSTRYCIYCDQATSYGRNVKHKPDCPVVLAQELMRTE